MHASKTKLMNFFPYLQEFSNHVKRKNGNELANLLTYQHQQHSKSDRLLDAYVSSDASKDIDKHINSPWNDMCIYHLNICDYLRECAFVAAFKEHCNLVQVFTKWLGSLKNENWMLPVVNVLIRDLRQLAIAADLEATLSQDDKQVQKPHVYLENAAELMMGLFRVTATGKSIFYLLSVMTHRKPTLTVRV